MRLNLSSHIRSLHRIQSLHVASRLPVLYRGLDFTFPMINHAEIEFCESCFVGGEIVAGEEGLVEGDCLVGELGLDFLSCGLEWLSEEGVRGERGRITGL